MQVLLVNPYDRYVPKQVESYNIFKSLTQQIFQELQIPDNNFIERDVDQLGDYIVDWEHDPLHDEVKQTCKAFDKLDIIFIGGDIGKLCPWDPTCTQLVTLLHMANLTKKPVVGTSFGAFAIIYATATKGSRFYLLNGTKGDHLDVLPSFPRYSSGTGIFPSAWLENQTGDLYIFNPKVTGWQPVCNIGAHFRTVAGAPPSDPRLLNSNIRSYGADHRAPDRPPSGAVSSTVGGTAGAAACELNSRPVLIKTEMKQHPIVRSLESNTFHTQDGPEWFLNTSGRGLPPNQGFIVIADGERGPVVLCKESYMLLLACSMDRGSSWNVKKEIIKNFIKQAMPPEASTFGRQPRNRVSAGVGGTNSKTIGPTPRPTPPASGNGIDRLKANFSRGSNRTTSTTSKTTTMTTTTTTTTTSYNLKMMTLLFGEGGLGNGTLFEAPNAELLAANSSTAMARATNSRLVRVSASLPNGPQRVEAPVMSLFLRPLSSLPAHVQGAEYAAHSLTGGVRKQSTTFNRVPNRKMQNPKQMEVRKKRIEIAAMKFGYIKKDPQGLEGSSEDDDEEEEDRNGKLRSHIPCDKSGNKGRKLNSASPILSSGGSHLSQPTSVDFEGVISKVLSDSIALDPSQASADSALPDAVQDLVSGLLIQNTNNISSSVKEQRAARVTRIHESKVLKAHNSNMNAAMSKALRRQSFAMLYVDPRFTLSKDRQAAREIANKEWEEELRASGMGLLASKIENGELIDAASNSPRTRTSMIKDSASLAACEADAASTQLHENLASLSSYEDNVRVPTVAENENEDNEENDETDENDNDDGVDDESSPIASIIENNTPFGPLTAEDEKQGFAEKSEPSKKLGFSNPHAPTEPTRSSSNIKPAFRGRKVTSITLVDPKAEEKKRLKYDIADVEGLPLAQGSVTSEATEDTARIVLTAPAAMETTSTYPVAHSSNVKWNDIGGTDTQRNNSKISSNNNNNNNNKVPMITNWERVSFAQQQHSVGGQLCSQTFRNQPHAPLSHSRTGHGSAKTSRPTVGNGSGNLSISPIGTPNRANDDVDTQGIKHSEMTLRMQKLSMRINHPKPDGPMFTLRHSKGPANDSDDESECSSEASENIDNLIAKGGIAQLAHGGRAASPTTADVKVTQRVTLKSPRALQSNFKSMTRKFQEIEESEGYQGYNTRPHMSALELEIKEYNESKKKFVAGPFKNHHGKASKMPLRPHGCIQGQGPYPKPPSFGCPRTMVAADWPGMKVDPPSTTFVAGSWK